MTGKLGGVMGAATEEAVGAAATTGEGDAPDEATGFLRRLMPAPPDLSHLQVGVLALGDSSYGDSFLGGGKQFDAKLQDLGARKIGDTCVLDAMETMTPEDDAVAWLQSWAVEWATLK